jgi:hypothetical protein
MKDYMEENERRKYALIKDIFWRRAGIKSLVQRNDDDVEFHFISVDTLRGMMYEAFETGMEFDNDIRGQYESHDEHNS